MEMKETIIMINVPEIMEDIKFRKAVNALGTYKSTEEYLDAMVAITERDMAEDPSFPHQKA